MNSFVISLLIVLTLSPLLIRSNFCKRQPKVSKDKLKFIATKDILYLYLNIPSEQGEYVYTLDVTCNSTQNCPKIGAEKQLSQVFSGVKGMRDAFIQNGFTYFIMDSDSFKSQKVLKFENTNKIEEKSGPEFWANITHSTVYNWKDNQKTVMSRFIPTETPKGRPGYGFAFDTFDGKLTVELKGNHNGINIIRSASQMTLYTFDNYMVPTQFYGYLPLPNGDDIFHSQNNSVYIRKDGASLTINYSQDMNKIFCPKTALPKRKMSDTKNDIIYPKYFT